MAKTRDAFLYLEPKQKENEEDFAQCSTCMMWTSEKGKNPNRCHIHGKDTEVTGDMSCGIYVEGKPMPDGPIMPLVTPEESGLVKRKVRCENCLSFDGKSKCLEYRRLNSMPGWDLDENVIPKGCCNAQEPKKNSLKVEKNY